MRRGRRRGGGRGNLFLSDTLVDVDTSAVSSRFDEIKGTLTIGSVLSPQDNCSVICSTKGYEKIFSIQNIVV